MTNKTVLFLGYDRNQTRLVSLIEKHGWSLEQTDNKVADASRYDLVLSFGYRHILKREFLATARRPVLNLHIAYLPWNRGAHPLFWAMFDGTPAGVTIHEIDTGIDTGPICFQKEVPIDPQSETFSSAYQRLVQEVEALFEAHISELLNGEYVSRPQSGAGSCKRVRDLPSGFTWSDVIAPTIQRLKQV
jgi:methionyl-tRNA formyltransferase